MEVWGSLPNPWGFQQGTSSSEAQPQRSHNSQYPKLTLPTNQPMMTLIKLIVIALLLACIDAGIVPRTDRSNVLTHSVQTASQLRLLDASAKMETTEEMMDLVNPSEEPLAPTTPPGRRRTFVFRNSTVGFIRVSGAGVSVTAGASATLRFSISMEALQADVLAENDKDFRSKLTPDEDMEYKKLRANYTGGLNVPYMEWIGANLEGNVTRRDLVRSALTQDNYNSKAFVARQLLTARTPTKVTVSGSITVSGNSFIPRTFFAFIKAAQVELNDGSTILVVSTDSVDSAAATVDGFSTASSVESLEVAEEVV